MRPLPKISGSMVFLLLFLPVCVPAHGTGYRLLSTGGARAVGCYYSSGAPMAYAKVLVYAPDETEIEHQNGRTDRLGSFAFLPDRPGTWRMIVSDGQGHRMAAEVNVDPERTFDDWADGAGPGGQEGESHRPGILGAVCGVSLLFNIAAAFRGFRRSRGAWRRRGPRRWHACR